MRSLLRCPLGLLPLLVAVSAQAGTVTFFDGTFNDADWQKDAFEQLNGGTSVATQVMSDGDPGAYFRIVNVLNSGAVNSAVYGLYLKPTASYTPSTQGAILNGSLTIDTQMFLGFGDGEATRTLLSQDGKLYIRIGDRINNNNSGSWSNPPKGQTFSQNDFQLISQGSGTIVFSPTIHPDFSDTGSTIVFGFSSANSTTATAGYTIDAGYDNWTVTLNTVPEPSSMVLLAIGGIAVWGRRRRSQQRLRSRCFATSQRC